MTFYMHVYGEGDAVALAHDLHEPLVLSKTPLGLNATAPPAPQGIDLDTAASDHALGAKGEDRRWGVSGRHSSQESGHGKRNDRARSMGSAESVNFQPTRKGKAAITGDFVLTACEVNPVLRALREYGIEITALHNHMLNEEPRLFFHALLGERRCRQSLSWTTSGASTNRGAKVGA